MVREQLAGKNFPSDAVGKTSSVEGKLVFGSGGRVLADQSKIKVDLRTLKSDESRRDNYLRRNTLETSRFPFAELTVTDLVGLPSPLPASGDYQLSVIGDLNVHGVSQRVTWLVNATFQGDTIRGTATTSFRFADFDMEIPRVFLVISVEDNIRLKVNFVFSVST